MKKAEIIIIITIAVLAVMAIVVGTIAFKNTDKKAETTTVSEISEKESETSETTTTPEETTTERITTTTVVTGISDSKKIYDENGNLIEEVTIDKMYHYFYEYDDNGNIAKGVGSIASGKGGGIIDSVVGAGQGIINGYADGTFLPNNHITRGQMAKILYNLM